MNEEQLTLDETHRETESLDSQEAASAAMREERDSTLLDLFELAGRLAAEIPEDVRRRERALMVAYLDEVAAREPSRPPGTGKC